MGGALGALKKGSMNIHTSAYHWEVFGETGGEINFNLSHFLMSMEDIASTGTRLNSKLDGVPEDLEHTFLYCPTFVKERWNLEETLRSTWLVLIWKVEQTDYECFVEGKEIKPEWANSPRWYNNLWWFHGERRIELVLVDKTHIHWRVQASVY